MGGSLCLFGIPVVLLNQILWVDKIQRLYIANERKSQRLWSAQTDPVCTLAHSEWSRPSPLEIQNHYCSEKRTREIVYLQIHCEFFEYLGVLYSKKDCLDWGYARCRCSATGGWGSALE